MTEQNQQNINDKRKLVVNHKGEDLSFITCLDPLYSTYVEVGKSLGDLKLKKPTISQIVSLVYTSILNLNDPKGNSDRDSDSFSVLASMWYLSLYGFTGILSVPNEGVYIEDYPRIKNGEVVIEKKDGKRR